MHLPPTLLALGASPIAIASARALPSSTPTPTITNITYWGSACPPDSSGLTYTLPPPPQSNTTTTANTTTSTTLSFTLSNFLPTYGSSFGGTLRMCNAVAFVNVAQGWKVVVNEQATKAKGRAEVPGGARMYLRGSWSWAESMGSQSVGMYDTPGPLSGPFTHELTPVDGSSGGVTSGCAGGDAELDVEFQARAVNDTFIWQQEEQEQRERGLEAEVDTSWTLTTDVQVVKC